jgi:hypothetical protein
MRGTLYLVSLPFSNLMHETKQKFAKLGKYQIYLLAILCVVSMVQFFLVEMMNSYAVNFLRMPSYNLVLCLILNSLAKCSNLKIETCV